MKKYLFIASMALFASCATRKYGCGLTTINAVNKTPSTLCRGYGKVSVLDTINSPYMLLLRIKSGVIIKDDFVLEPTKYIVVYEGEFFNQLKAVLNKEVYFETTLVYPNVFDGPEIQYTGNGCIEKTVGTEINKNVVLVNYKK